MDWENERYVRRYVRETVDDAVLSWQAIAIWDRLLTRFDRAGVIDIGEHGWKGVAALIRIPLDVVREHGPELLADGRVEMRGQYLLAPNYIAAQEAKQSDKLRQAECRGRRRDQALSAELVTLCDTTSQTVTKDPVYVTPGHTVSHGVTPSLAVPSLAVPSLAVPSRTKPSRTKPSSPNTRTRVYEFDFEAAYLAYPRKAGRVIGLKAAKRMITKRADYERLLDVCRQMGAAWDGHDKKFCPHFSTFVNQERWKDETPPMPEATGPIRPDPSNVTVGDLDELQRRLEAEGM